MPGHPRGSTSEEFGATMQEWAAKRLVYLDNLKVAVIAAIIAVHGVLGYAGVLVAWSYTEVREVTLSPLTEIPLTVAIAPFAFLMIPLLFLLAGLLTPASLQRKGTGAYVRDRLVRLGVPFAVYVFAVQPTLMYALDHPLGDATGSYWQEYLGAERQLDTGPLWFVGVLLIVNLGYAGWARTRRPRLSAAGSAPITAGRLVLVAAAVAPASFLIRLVYPYAGESGFTDLNYWQWPSCLAAFGLGTVAARRGWLTAVPDRLYRRSRTVAALAAVVMTALLTTVGLLDVVDRAMGGWHWQALAFAMVDGVLTVFGAVWLLGLAQRHLGRSVRWGPTLSRCAYGAFMLQAPVLIGLAVALRPLPLIAEAKAVLVAAAGVAGSFALAWLLIRRVPAVARVL
jgi:glucan biosynthesis protein C